MLLKRLPPQRHLQEVFTYDPLTGALTWKARKSLPRRAGDQAGGWNACGYRTVRLDGELYLAHRIIWKMVHGVDPAFIDHINRDRGDNALSNLRSVTTATNACNTRLRSNNTSGLRGVSRKRDKWRAQITFQGKSIPLGSYDCPVVAGVAFRMASACRDEINSGNNTIKYLSFDEGPLIDAIQTVFGGES